MHEGHEEVRDCVLYEELHGYAMWELINGENRLVRFDASDSFLAFQGD